MTGLMKALIVEENNVMRETLAWLLGMVEGIGVVEQLSDGGKMDECVNEGAPDIILLDAGLAVRESEKLIDFRQSNRGIKLFALTESDKALFEQTEVASKVRFDGVINKDEVYDKISDMVARIAMTGGNAQK